MDYSVFERLGIGWNDTVADANEKRSREYDRQQEESMDWAHSGYKREWDSRVPPGVTDVDAWILENRRKYEAGFDSGEGKTQLAVSIPVEESLRSLLEEAQNDVVNCMNLMSKMFSPDQAKDMRTSNTWVPDMAHIPQKDMHVTVCIPSLWREPNSDAGAHKAYNDAVCEALATAAKDHEAFVLEVDRIILGKDGSLIALFRTVGSPEGEGPELLSDRGSTDPDPMCSLRADVLYVFLEKGLANFQQNKSEQSLAAVSSQPKLMRQATIVKTVGGSVHGYIHCSLSRLAIGPTLTKCEVDMKVLQRICRSWTAKLAGKRMLVRGFTVTEMTGLGAGGNKNPFDKASWSRPVQFKTAQKPTPARTPCGGCFPW